MEVSWFRNYSLLINNNYLIIWFLERYEINSLLDILYVVFLNKFFDCFVGIVLSKLLFTTLLERSLFEPYSNPLEMMGNNFVFVIEVFHLPLWTLGSLSLYHFACLSLFLNIANYWDSYLFTGVGFGLSYESFLSAIKTNLNYQKHLDIVSIPSAFITILVELGLIGFIILNLTIFFPLYYCYKRNKILIVLIFCIFLTQLTDISVFRFHPFNFLFAFLIGLISNNNYQNEKIEK